MKPGIYTHLSNNEYHASIGVSKSGLDLVRISTAKYQYKVLNRHIEEDPGPAKVIGTAVHAAILEPELFKNRYIFQPRDMKRNTTAGKLAYANLLNISAGKVILKEDDYEKVVAISENAKKHEWVKKHLIDGYAERSVFWNDPDTGVLCKCRPDYYTQELIIDLKTTDDAGLDFIKSIELWGYHRQAAFYSDGMKEVQNKKKFIFVALEKDPPYEIGIYELDEDDFEIGRIEYKSALRKYLKCEEEKFWPGLPAEVQKIKLSEFYKNKVLIKEGIINGI